MKIKYTGRGSTASAHASGVVDFELHTLGWKAFQDLCATVLQEVLGQTIQTFLDSNDGGRDGAFQGYWKRRAAEEFRGHFTVQCKFTARRDSRLSLSHLKDELEKAKRLGDEGLAATYILITNAHLSGITEERLRKAFLSIRGIKYFSAFGFEWLCGQIRKSAKLRMLVPRIYGVGDLSQILDVRAYEQAAEILSYLGDDLAKFVITDAYRKAAKAVSRHRFVLLLGEPACGKSTIAAALAVGAIDRWSCPTLKVRDADDFVAHWNPNEPEQFFWIDDAFGATQFNRSTADAWNRVFPHMRAALRRGARVLFTSRDYIYYSACQHLKATDFPLLRQSQVVIDIDRLFPREREQILYNHIRLGNHPRKYRARLRPYLASVAAHRNFKPEIARRLGDRLFTRTLSISAGGLDDFVANPIEHLVEVMTSLDAGARAALGMIFMRGGSLSSPLDLSKQEIGAARLLGGRLSDIRESLAALNGSMVIKILDEGRSFWRFKHPTMRDAYATLVAGDVELLDVYLAGVSAERLLEEVTCGDLGIRGVKIVVPADWNQKVIDRLDTLEAALDDELKRFLTDRCDKLFLEAYVQRHPELVGRLRVHSYLNAVADVGLIARLHEFGILPEEKRRWTAKRIQKLAIETPDPDWLEKQNRRLLTRGERRELMEMIRAELLPRLDDTIDTWRDNYSPEGDESEPEGYFSPLKHAIKRYAGLFGDDTQVQKLVSHGIAYIDRAVERIASDIETTGGDYDYDVHEKVSHKSSERSIFDDVDQ